MLKSQRNYFIQIKEYKINLNIMLKINYGMKSKKTRNNSGHKRRKYNRQLICEKIMYEELGKGAQFYFMFNSDHSKGSRTILLTIRRKIINCCHIRQRYCQFLHIAYQPFILPPPFFSSLCIFVLSNIKYARYRTYVT